MEINLNKLKILMEEIGPSISNIETVIQGNESDWAIQFEDQTIVTIEWCGTQKKAVISTILGRPSSTIQLSVYETLLCYNLLWRDTGGLKMGLGGEGGEIFLLYEIYIDSIKLNELKIILINFLNIAQIWIGYINSNSEENILINSESVEMINFCA